MGKSTPKPPDPAKTIAAQSAANKEAITESARVNAVDQFGPGGSTTYQKDGSGVPTSQTIKLTPSGQATYNMQEQIAQGLTDKAGQLAYRIPTGPMDLSGVPGRQSSIPSAGPVPTAGAMPTPGAMPTSTVPQANGSMASQAGLTTGVDVPALQMAVASRSGELQRDIDARTGELQRGINARTGEVSNLGMQDYGAATKTTQDATFGKAQLLLQPGQQLEQQRLQQSLSDRGIPLDSAAGRAELTRMAQSQSEANNRSAYDAVAAGSAEQSRLFGLDATRTSINNSAAGQRFGQDLGAGQFRNSATGQAFGQDLSAGQFRNDATDRAFGQDLASGQFANAAAGQLFGMGTSNAQLNNSAQGQAFGQNMASQNADFSQGMARQGTQFEQEMARQQAQFGQGMQSQQTQFNQNLTGANFANDQRSSALQEAMSLRNQDFNEASALLQGAPVMGTPNFQNTPTYGMQPVDAAGIYQNDYQNRLAASQANSPWQGLFGLGSAAITKWSDRRLKMDIQRIASGPMGLALYVFRYVWGGPLVSGFMAQDVAKVRPDAVAEGLGGWLTIDYRKLGMA